MSHHYSGPNIGFPHGDAHLDLTDLFAFPNPGNVGKSILISLVFIDETAVTTKMVRHYGRSPRGERLVASVPHGHWKTLTFIAALRFDGMTAPYVIDGAMDGPTFIAYVEQVLTPTLKKGDVVFMDNLRTHKVDGVRQAIEAAPPAIAPASQALT